MKGFALVEGLTDGRDIQRTQIDGIRLVDCGYLYIYICYFPRHAS